MVSESREVGITGLRELDAALQELSVQMRRNLVRTSLRHAAGVLADDARRRIRSRSGNLAGSIRISTRVRGERITATVTAGGGSPGANGEVPFYAHMVEYGTVRHVIRAGPGKMLRIGNKWVTWVMHPGSRPRPFMRPALDTKGEAAMQMFRDQLLNRIDATARRLARQGGGR